MADILVDNQVAPLTPASSKSVLWVDSTGKKLTHTDDGGVHRGVFAASQMVGASGASSGVDTYVNNSGLLIPSYGIQVGMHFFWRVHLSKTAAGVTAATVTFRIGSAQSVADATIAALTQTIAQAATADSGILEASAYVTIASAVGVMACAFQPGGAGSNLGGGKDQQSTTLDLTSRQGQYVGISINAQSLGVWTWTGVWARGIQ